METLVFYRSIAGSLSKPSKLPGWGYGLPALESCPTGRVLATVEGTPCASCYALRGNYQFPVVRAAQKKRMLAVAHPRWEEAMIALIGTRKKKFFRWHDSGDIMNLEHLMKIDYVCRALPDFHFWLPTNERLTVALFLELFGPVSDNLTIRLSSSKVDSRPPKTNLCTSSVHKYEKAHGFSCPSSTQDNKCGDCRACWDRNIKNVSYKYH